LLKLNLLNILARIWPLFVHE
jgi:hypothetical protein